MPVLSPFPPIPPTDPLSHPPPTFCSPEREPIHGGTSKSGISFGEGPKPSPVCRLREHPSMCHRLPKFIRILG